LTGSRERERCCLLFGVVCVCLENWNAADTHRHGCRLVRRPPESLAIKSPVGVSHAMSRLAKAVHERVPVLAVVNANEWAATAEAFELALDRIRDTGYAARVRKFHKGHSSARECRHHEMEDPKCFVLGQALYATAFGAKAAALRTAAAAAAAAAANNGGTADAAAVDAVDVQRTAEGKPHIGNLATWMNGNVSHAGGVVAFAGLDVPGYVVGCDVMPVELAPPEPIGARSVQEFFSLFRDYFTAAEWRWINANVDAEAAAAAIAAPQRAQMAEGGDAEGRVVAFFEVKRFLTLWTLKEALIKAMGIGLGFELQRASFALTRADVWAPDFYTPATTVSLALDSRPAPTWHFTLFEKREWNVVVATGVAPVCFAGESTFLRTFDAAIAKSGFNPPTHDRVRQMVCEGLMHTPLVLEPTELLLAAGFADPPRAEEHPADASVSCTSGESSKA
jgi:phosphopantetheinyl transferase